MNTDGDDAGINWGAIVNEFSRRVQVLQNAGYTLSARRRSAALAARLGQPRSQHIVGTAADFVVEPERVPAFVELARRQGLVVVNEQDPKFPGSTGPHMHVQMFKRGQVPAAVFRRYSGPVFEETP